MNGLLPILLLFCQDPPKEQPLRVLLLEHRPRVEYQLLKNALLKDESIELRSFLASADKDWEQPASKGSEPLTWKTVPEMLTDPARLAREDVVIWGDLGPDHLSPKPQIREKIAATLEGFARTGKGVLLVAGPAYGGKGSESVLFERLFPCTLKSPSWPEKREDPKVLEEIRKCIELLGDDDIETREKASARLTKIGAPAVALLSAAAQSADAEVRERARAILEDIVHQVPEVSMSIRAAAGDRGPLKNADPGLWGRTPRLRWWLGIVPPKDAETWAETESGDPLLCGRVVEKGRVALVATDEWWLWRRGRGDQDYYATYKALLRWIAGRT